MVFVLGEFSLVTVDRHSLEQLTQAGDRRARRALASLRSLSSQLSAAQLGITITSLVLGFVAEPTIARAIHPLVRALPFVPEGSSLGVSVGVALAVATLVQMIVGELVPKNWAIARPVGTALAVSGLLRAFARLFRPLISVLNGAANGTVRLLGMEPREELTSVRTLEELDLLIRASTDEGALGREESSLLARSIGFAHKTAADALVPRVDVVALSERAPLAELVDRSRETGRSRFPIYREDLDDIVGVVHVKDVFRVADAERGLATVRMIAHPTIVVPEAGDLGSLLTEMRASGRQLAVVVDEYGGTAGIVTLEDILEEIVGEIEDEYDSAVSSLATDASVVSGMLHDDELRELTGFSMPEGDYDTLAGFLLDRLARIPSVGEHIEDAGWRFEIVEMDAHRIASVRVTPPEREAQ